MAELSTRSIAALVAVLSLLSAAAFAYSQDAQAKKFQLASPPWEWETATHEYLGLGPQLADRGITLDATLTADFAKNLMGGVNTEGYNFGHLLSVSLALDTEKLKLWKGGTVYMNFQNENGEFATRDVGDIQIADNLDADGRTQISELWYGQKFLDDKLNVKLGKIDPNAEVDTSPISANFINSSCGALPTVLGLPLYPDPATGVQVIYDGDHLYVDAGVFDGATQAGIATGDKGPATFFGSPSALFLIAEGGPKWKIKDDSLDGKLGIGIWRHTGHFDRFDGGTDHGTNGFYLLFDQQLYRKNPKNDDDDQGVGLFLRYGWADPKVSVIEHSIVGGIACTGCIPTRDHDVMGLAVNCAILSTEDGAGVDKRAETAIELFYKIQILPWLAVQPDVQYILNPGGVSSQDNSLLAILRITVDL